MVLSTCDETHVSFFEIQNLIFFGTDVLSSILFLLFVRRETFQDLFLEFQTFYSVFIIREAETFQDLFLEF